MKFSRLSYLFISLHAKSCATKGKYQIWWLRYLFFTTSATHKSLSKWQKKTFFLFCLFNRIVTILFLYFNLINLSLLFIHSKKSTNVMEIATTLNAFQHKNESSDIYNKKKKYSTEISSSGKVHAAMMRRKFSLLHACSR